MAEIKGTVTYPVRGQIQITWSGLQSGDWGSWEGAPSYPDKTVHVFGTFGTSSVRIEGANSAVTGSEAVLKDGNGTPLSGLVAASVAVLRDNPTVIRPMLVGGSGANITVVLVGRRS